MRSSPVRRLAVACAAAALLVAAGPAGAQAGTLLHWYPAEGDATDAVLGPDASNGTLLEDTVFGTGRLGQGFVFDGSDDLVTIPTNASFYPSGSATLEAWARTKDAGPAGTLSGTIATLYECAGFCPSNAANASFTLYVDKGRATGFVRDDDASGPADQGQGQRISGGPLVDDAAFHHFVLLRDIEAGLLVLYVDGLGVAEAAAERRCRRAADERGRRDGRVHDRRADRGRHRHADRGLRRRDRRGAPLRRHAVPGHHSADLHPCRHRHRRQRRLVPQPGLGRVAGHRRVDDPQQLGVRHDAADGERDADLPCVERRRLEQRIDRR